MVEGKALGKNLQIAVKTGKCVLGFKEVSKSLRGSKLVVLSTSLGEDKKRVLIEGCRSSAVPLIEYPGTTMDLGMACGRRFRVSAVSVKLPGEADFTQMVEALQRK